MFYSHEVLTSRKYGVATVWLVATLGSTSTSKKITRKAIQEVDVPKACRTITNPVAPMALRLQGNLLYGVSRVYLEQCGFVLSDAQDAYNSIHLMLKAVRNAAIDLQATKARPEQLILPDDPSFLPEFAMPPPELLAELHLASAFPIRSMQESQSLTPLASQQDPSTPRGPIGAFILPTSSSVGPGEFVFHGGDASSSIGGPAVIADEDMIDDPGFTFGEDGELIDLTEVNLQPRTPTGPGGSNMPGDIGASARVRQEHEEGLQAANEQADSQMDLDMPILNDDHLVSDTLPTQHEDLEFQHSEVVESVSSVSAENRPKKRAGRVLPLDHNLELRNTDLSDWNTNYLANMKEASKRKDLYKNMQAAKKNAEYWVWGSGIGGIAARSQGIGGPSPFDRFVGDQLFELFTGVSRDGSKGSKRDRDSGIDEATQDESRRVRQKTEDLVEQQRRDHEDGDILMIGEDEIEMPREDPSAQDQQQILSDMPWNISASIRGSSVAPRSGRLGSVGAATIPSSIRGGRMISASPLQGRGQLPGSPLNLEANDIDFDNLGVAFGFSDPGFSSDAPEAAFAAIDAPFRETLSSENGNFLTFVMNAIRGEGNHEQDLQTIGSKQNDADSTSNEISFDELFPPTENSKVVASQAFIMALTLGTKGLLDLRQERHLGCITLSLIGKPKSLQVADEGVDDVVAEAYHDGMEIGHFEDQFAAGHGEADQQSGPVYAA